MTNWNEQILCICVFKQTRLEFGKHTGKHQKQWKLRWSLSTKQIDGWAKDITVRATMHSGLGHEQ